MKKNILLIFFLILLGSCEKEPSAFDAATQLLYDADSIIGKQQEHYKSIKKIELISAEDPEFIEVISSIESIEDFITINTTRAVKKYTYNFDVVSYNIDDFFIFNYMNEDAVVLRIFSEEFEKEKTITISNIDKSRLFYEVQIDLLDKNISKIVHFNDSPVNRSITQQQNKDPYCDDLPWDDCMDCTVSDCGGEWWCVGLLIIAPGETMAGMAFSCLFDLPNNF